MTGPRATRWNLIGRKPKSSRWIPMDTTVTGRSTWAARSQVPGGVPPARRRGGVEVAEVVLEEAGADRGRQHRAAQRGQRREVQGQPARSPAVGGRRGQRRPASWLIRARRRSGHLTGGGAVIASPPRIRWWATGPRASPPRSCGLLVRWSATCRRRSGRRHGRRRASSSAGSVPETGRAISCTVRPTALWRSGEIFHWSSASLTSGASMGIVYSCGSPVVDMRTPWCGAPARRARRTPRPYCSAASPAATSRSSWDV